MNLAMMLFVKIFNVPVSTIIYGGIYYKIFCSSYFLIETIFIVKDPGIHTNTIAAMMIP